MSHCMGKQRKLFIVSALINQMRSIMEFNDYTKILVTALLVTGMLVSFVGVSTATNHTVSLEDGDNFWTGQELEYTDTTNDLTQSDMEVLEVDDDGNREFVTEVGADDEDTLTIDSEGYLTGSYVLVVDGNSQQNEVEFDLRVQELDITAEDSQVVNDGSEDSTTSFNVDSNRVGFQMNVTTDGLDANELQGIFGGGTTVDDDTLQVGEDQLDSVDFEDVDTSEYLFEFEVVDANSNSTSIVTVSEPGDAQGVFTQSTFSANEGDTGEITLDLEETDEARVTFGDEEEIGYELVFNVTDGDDDGEVTVEFDSYLAGQSSNVVSSEDDDVTFVEQTGFDSDQRLVPERYELSVEVEENGVFRQTDLSFFDLNERSTDGATSYGVPAANQITQYEDIENLTEADVVAEGDSLVVEFDVNGVFGAFNQEGVTAADDLSEGSSLDNNRGIYVEVFETNPGPNSQEETVGLDDAELYYNESEEQVFVVYEVDVDNTDYELDKSYTAELVVTEDSDYVEDEDEEEVVNTTYEIAEEDTSFVGLNDEDELEFEESDQVQVTANTNLAEGTEDEFVVTLTDADDPAVDEYEVTVEDGQLTTMVNTSGLEPGDQFTVDLRNADVDETTANVIEATPEYELSVEVVDEDGNLVETAAVTVDEETQNGSQVNYTLTNGEYVVAVQAEGFQTVSETVTIEDEPESTTVTLTPTEEQTEEYQLTVDAVDQNGTAVENAEITVDGETESGSQANFTVVEGNYDVTVTADGFEDENLNVTVEEDSTATATLTATDQQDEQGQDDEGQDNEDNQDNNNTDTDGEDENEDGGPDVVLIGGVVIVLAALGGLAVYATRSN